MQHVAENKTCSDVNENKDQTSEIAALKRESNILKTELNVLKDLILRQVRIYIYIYESVHLSIVAGLVVRHGDLSHEMTLSHEGCRPECDNDYRV